MISKLTVRSRLLIVLAVPLLALTALTGVYLQSELTARSEAINDRALAQSAADLSAAESALRLEQILGVGSMLTGDEAVSDRLSTARTETDEALAATVASLGAVDIEDPSGQVQRLVGRYGEMISNLPSTRAEVDAADPSEVVTVLDDYDVDVDLVGELLTTVSGATSTALNLNNHLVLDRALSAVNGQMAYALVKLGPDPDNAMASGRFDVLQEDAESFSRTFRTSIANASERAILDRALKDERARPAGAVVAGLIAQTSPEDLGTTPEQFALDAADRVTVLADAQAAVQATDLQAAQAMVDESTRQAAVALAIAVSALVASAAIASLVVRSVIRPLRRLSEATECLATETLPTLVDSLINPNIEPPPVVPMGIHSKDEIGQLAAALDDVQTSIVEVAQQQSEVVTRGISDMYVNLARRNQSLLDRQIRYIDSLESTEQDPDQLERLFRLDHLATRMRRNAESLLVLAGAEQQARKRAKAVPLMDVVRVAIGEVEDYQRIEILEIGPARLRGAAAVDLAHLLSELMENGTQYSPPETTVDVVGHAAQEGSYALVLTDHGMGMTAEQLAEANERLATAPSLGLGSGRSLGFVVVAALAARHGVSVRLSAGQDGGVVAAVTLPAALLEQGADAPTETSGGAPGAGYEAHASTFSDDHRPAAMAATASMASSSPAPSSMAPTNHGERGAGSGEERPLSEPEPVSSLFTSEPTRRPPPGPFGEPRPADLQPLPSRNGQAPDTNGAGDHAGPNAGQLAPIGPTGDGSLPNNDPFSGETPVSAEPSPDHSGTASTWTDDAVGWAPPADQVPATPLDPYAPNGTTPSDDALGFPPAEGPATHDWTPPEVPHQQAPPPPDGDPESLVDAVPLGDAFEMGLYSLLDEDQDASASEAPPHHDSDLPQRAQGEALGDGLGDADQVVAGASTRSPDQVRSLLSNYRSARERGRLDAADDDPEVPAGDQVPAPGGFDPLGGRSFAGEEGHTDEPGRR